MISLFVTAFLWGLVVGLQEVIYRRFVGHLN